MIGSDDVLACFIAGNVFTWDDWFRLETMDDSLQPTIDMLLNVAIFMWFGAVCPWHIFLDNNVIPIYRLIPLGILVLLLRRLPMVLAFHKFIHQVEDMRHALFVGFFGPIGVSAIFYLYIAREFLRTIQVDGVQREDAAHLSEVLLVVIWFLAICSIVVHGLSIPVGKLGFYLPRTLSTALSSDRNSFNVSTDRINRSDGPVNQAGTSGTQEERQMAQHFRRRRLTSSDLGGRTAGSHTNLLPKSLSRFGHYLFHDIGRPHGTTVHGADGIRNYGSSGGKSSGSDQSGSPKRPEISAPRDPRIIGHTITERATRHSIDEGRRVDAVSHPTSPVDSPARTASPEPGSPEAEAAAPVVWQRSIRFGDEPPNRA
jgi:hypothetical protein